MGILDWNSSVCSSSFQMTILRGNRESGTETERETGTALAGHIHNFLSILLGNRERQREVLWYTCWILNEIRGVELSAPPNWGLWLLCPLTRALCHVTYYVESPYFINFWFFYGCYFLFFPFSSLNASFFLGKII